MSETGKIDNRYRFGDIYGGKIKVLFWLYIFEILVRYLNGNVLDLEFEISDVNGGVISKYIIF